MTCSVCGKACRASPARDEGERTNEGGRVGRRIDAGLALRDRLKAAREPFNAQVVTDLVHSLRASNALNKVLHRDLQRALAALSPAQTGGTAVAWRGKIMPHSAWEFRDYEMPVGDLWCEVQPLYPAPVAEGAREKVREAIRGTRLRNPLLGVYTVGGAINADILSDIEDSILQSLDTGTNRGPAK